MGVPAADRHGMHTWTQLILSSSHGAEVSEKARKEMGAYFADLITRRQSSTGEDVASLLGAAVGREEITLEEAVGLAVLLQIGGEAVTDNSGQMFYILLTRPNLAERLRAEPEIRPQAIDELLRYIPHRNTVGLSRIAVEDVGIQGVRIRAGDAIYVSYLSANRDPDVFADPETIDFSRSPNPHVSFGFGPALLPRRPARPDGVRAAGRRAPRPYARAETGRPAERSPVQEGRVDPRPRSPPGDVVIR